MLGPRDRNNRPAVATEVMKSSDLRQGTGSWHWADPSQQPNTHTAAYSFPPPKVWGENRRKVGIFMNQDKDRRISEAKAVHTSKAK